MRLISHRHFLIPAISPASFAPFARAVLHVNTPPGMACTRFAGDLKQFSWWSFASMAAPCRFKMRGIGLGQGGHALSNTGPIPVKFILSSIAVRVALCYTLFQDQPIFWKSMSCRCAWRLREQKAKSAGDVVETCWQPKRSRKWPPIFVNFLKTQLASATKTNAIKNGTYYLWKIDHFCK